MLIQITIQVINQEEEEAFFFFCQKQETYRSYIELKIKFSCYLSSQGYNPKNNSNNKGQVYYEQFCRFIFFFDIFAVI